MGVGPSKSGARSWPSSDIFRTASGPLSVFLQDHDIFVPFTAINVRVTHRTTRFHALRGNAVFDAPRPETTDAERQRRHSHGGPWERDGTTLKGLRDNCGRPCATRARTAVIPGGPLNHSLPFAPAGTRGIPARFNSSSKVVCGDRSVVPTLPAWIDGELEAFEADQVIGDLPLLFEPQRMPGPEAFPIVRHFGQSLG